MEILKIYTHVKNPELAIIVNDENAGYIIFQNNSIICSRDLKSEVFFLFMDSIVLYRGLNAQLSCILKIKLRVSCCRKILTTCSKVIKKFEGGFCSVTH